MVAMPFKLGRFFRAEGAKKPERKRARIGVRGSLFLAFAVIAAMALVISGGASILLDQLGRMMTGLAGADIPRLSASLQLTAMTESLASRAPALLQAETGAAREEQLKQLKTTQAAALAKIKLIKSIGGADETVVSGLEENVKNLDDMINSLNNAAKERIDTVDKREQQFVKMRSAHKEFVDAINAAMTDAKGAVKSALAIDVSVKPAPAKADDAGDEDKDAAAAAKAEAAAQADKARQDLARQEKDKAITEAMRKTDVLAALLAQGNQMAGDLSAAPAASKTEIIDAYKDTFKKTKKVMQEGVDSLASMPEGAALKAAFAKFFAFGEGKNSVFELRAKEIDSAEFSQLTLDETRKLSSGMDVGVKQLVENVQTSTIGATDRAHSLIQFSTLVMVAMGVGTLVGSFLFVWLYVGRNILRRIANLQAVMKRLAEGDLEAEVKASRAQDEVADMGRSLEVFRESMINARALSAEQDKDRVVKAERASKMEQQIATFEDTVRSALDTLSASASAMQSTAENMSVSADKSSALASAVASAAEETSVNVQTVSSGTEELSSSIQEISRQVSNSTTVAGKAVTEAGETDSTMQGLADCASRISTVVDLIQTIASQTNLLALNATIEAARAGESGRGFAVVASEVKSLADQTAKATDEIRSQIVTMQNVATSAVGAIRHIGQTISEINEVTTAIAAAVEEQGAATKEIARNIQHAASGTSEVSSNIVGVSQASSDAGNAASEVLTASAGLRREADMLRQEIDTFLAGIRAA
jgi:methyl-accepting chemotaxis protein